MDKDLRRLQELTDRLSEIVGLTKKSTTKGRRPTTAAPKATTKNSQVPSVASRAPVFDNIKTLANNANLPPLSPKLAEPATSREPVTVRLSPVLSCSRAPMALNTPKQDSTPVTPTSSNQGGHLRAGQGMFMLG